LIFINKFVIPAQAGIQRTIAARAAQYLTYCRLSFYKQQKEYRVLYTTNAIESLHSQLRKIIDNKRIFPHDDAVRKVLYLALKNIQKKWTMPLRDWKLTLAQFEILYPDAFHTQNS
jgi:transposase-like protein